MQEIIDKLKEYVDTRLRLAKLVAIEKSSSAIAEIIAILIISVFLLLAFLFVSLALGFYISELLGNSYSGFFIVALFYFLVALVVFLIKGNVLERTIVNTIIKKTFKEDSKEDKE
ncbi:phage holin family protein [Pseudopedobacter beijingensis]|uniref:Phage holin family protein n=1 Tax=Pseudopedobacter beijingensis TaxID=1207056 RepID=A0ABW4IBH7_9SPHI